MSQDRLQQIFDEQEAFMHLLQHKRGFPDFPVNLDSKESQKQLKLIAYDAMGELHEAVAELKNSKDHRATTLDSVDRAAFIEEIVDTVKFVTEIMVLAGVSSDEFFDAFLAKTHINTQRIEEGY